MRISTKVDYAVRIGVELAAAGDDAVTPSHLAHVQGIPLNFLEHIISDLVDAGLVHSDESQPDAYRLAHAADEVTIADVIRAVEGPLTTVRGLIPEEATYVGAADALPRVWIALRQNVRSIVEHVSLAAVVAHRLPASVDRLVDQPESWAAA